MRAKNVLLPTDLSKASKPALRMGVDLCRETGAKAHFLHVVRFAPGPMVMPYEAPVWDEKGEPRLEEVEAEFRRVIDEAVGESDVRFEKRVALGPHVATEILEDMGKHSIDAVVMGTHGRRGFRRFLLGSVAEEVVRKARRPVLTVGSRWKPELSSPLRILGAVDLVDGTPDVLQAVGDLSEVFDCEAELLHVIQPVYPAVYGSYGVPVRVDLQALEQGARGAFFERLEKSGLSERYSDLALAHGDPDVEIVDYARENAVDLIVLATHSRTGLPHVMLGSVADRVLRTAPCPVLTVPMNQRLEEERDVDACA